MINFLGIKSKADLCKYLDISEAELNYLLYVCPLNIKYFTFTVEKRNGSLRTIHSPNDSLKRIQSIIKDDLLDIYGDKSCVHGFVKGKSVKSNALQHVNKKYVLNIDLSDFFSTIHFGRVRGLFMSKIFSFPEKIATILAQIVCRDGILPQGAPTSPIISNFICRRLDNDLLEFAKRSKVLYSRYADDLTFSTNSPIAVKYLGVIKERNFQLSSEIQGLIILNDFKINYFKVRFSTKCQRQSVTGIVINQKVNIERSYYRKIRAVLYSCEKDGVEKASRIHFNRSGINYSKLKNPIEYFLKRLVGMISYIGFIKGKDDPIYRGLYKRIKTIVPNARLSIIYEKIENSTKTMILTEGKTDWKHMKAALIRFQNDGYFKDINCEFADYLDEHKVSNSELLKLCESIPKLGKKDHKTICVFDRDDKNFIPKVTSTQFFYKDWTNNVYSMVLPKPDHRDFDAISIEHFYMDEELFTFDQNHRRIFMSSEFDKEGFFHNKDENYRFVGKKEKLLNRFPFIIDSDVQDENKLSVALSKNDFADYILQNRVGFDNFNIDAFRKLFQHISQIDKLNCTIN